MNEKTPPPSLENIAAAIKFETRPSTDLPLDRTRLVASLNVASACWFSEHEARKHPEMLTFLKEKLKHHLLRQLYHNQIAEMHDAVNEMTREADRIMISDKFFAARDRLMKLAGYMPPPGFDDDEFDCGSGPNCGCEQFEFLLQPGLKRTSRD
jgi:hypothetical protein